MRALEPASEHASCTLLTAQRQAGGRHPRPDRHGLLRAVLCALLLVTSLPAAAQYKWVSAGGVVTYSDLPPPPGVTASVLAKGVSRPAAERDEVQLPAAVRTAVSKHPVVLYTARDCAPCQQARTHLSKRGIPFSERILETQDDAQAFKRIGFSEPSLPAVSVGKERLVGFEATQWDRLLDSAQYPTQVSLPPGYRTAPAQRLAATGTVRMNASEPAPTEQADAQGLSGTTRSARTLRAGATDSDATALQKPGTIVRF